METAHEHHWPTVSDHERVQNVAGSDGRSTADEIARLADLRDRGAISEEEFQQAKAKAIS